MNIEGNPPPIGNPPPTPGGLPVIGEGKVGMVPTEGELHGVPALLLSPAPGTGGITDGITGGIPPIRLADMLGGMPGKLPTGGCGMPFGRGGRGGGGCGCCG